ncbi:MAG TPA: CBS domain-containing protein [Dermatophilaceae bacterium]|nr:CBS domain-containing protein [Dermatophilaceae bacterium]
MRIKDVMRGKASQTIFTVKPDDTVALLLDVLAEHNIGAVVVSEDGRAVAGIISERDVVRHLGGNRDLVNASISSIMTTDVYTCGPDMDVAELAQRMTEGRFRHIPVVVDDAMVGLVSIGDVVKWRLSELQSERDHLAGYISQ